MSRSLVRAGFAVLTVAVYVSVVAAVCLVIATTSAHDGALSPSQMARAPFDAAHPSRVEVAGNVVGCHSANGGGVLVYSLKDEQGGAPDLVFVRYPNDGRPQHATGERVAFSGTRIGPAVVDASTDLLRPPL
jgi:hypothetical protein